MENLFANFLLFPGLVLAITVHEFAHAFTADRFGDPTPRAYGRLSLNPLRHLDPLGTIMLLFFRFGWGKPVPIDSYNLSRRQEILVSISGSVSNIFLAVIASVIFRFLPSALIFQFILINLALAVFNLLPIPPLDGSKILLNLLPPHLSRDWQVALDQYGPFILIAIIFLPIGGTTAIAAILNPVISFLLSILIP